MPRASEVAFNARFAEVLRGKHPLWREHPGVERTGVFPDAPQLRPDILVLAPDTQPVAIETEWAPAQTVEADDRTTPAVPGEADRDRAPYVLGPRSVRNENCGVDTGGGG